MTSERFVLTTINGHRVKEDGHHALPEFIVTYNNSNEIPKKVDTEDIYHMIKDKKTFTQRDYEELANLKSLQKGCFK